MKIIVLFFSLTVLMVSCTPQTKEIKIPFEYDGLIYVELTLNDSVKGKFIFDTGASGVYLDSTFVANSCVASYPIEKTEIERNIISEHKSIPLINEVLHFKLGDKQFRSNQTPILNLSGFEKEGIAGIIGLKFFKNSILNINFKEKHIIIFTPTYRSKLVQLNHIDYKLVNDKILTQALLTIDSETSLSGLFEIDLGYSEDVYLTQETAIKYKLNQKNTKVLKTAPPSDLGNPNKRMYELLASSIIFGENSARKITVSFSEYHSDGIADPDYIGIIGTPILAKFNFYIDFSEKKIYLDPLTNNRKKHTLPNSE